MEPLRPLRQSEIRDYIKNLQEKNAALQDENASLRSDLTDAQADVADAKADATELKNERVAFKADADVIALKAMNQTTFMALTASDRDIMIFKFLKAI